MPQFSYRARNSQGGLVEGVLDCPDRSVAIRQIEQLRYIPVKIEAVGSGGGAGAGPATAKPKAGTNGAAKAKTSPAANSKLKIPHSQLLIFTEQLGHLLRAGMTL